MQLIKGLKRVKKSNVGWTDAELSVINKKSLYLLVKFCSWSANHACYQGWGLALVSQLQGCRFHHSLHSAFLLSLFTLYGTVGDTLLTEYLYLHIWIYLRTTILRAFVQACVYQSLGLKWAVRFFGSLARIPRTVFRLFRRPKILLIFENSWKSTYYVTQHLCWQLTFWSILEVASYLRFYINCLNSITRYRKARFLFSSVNAFGFPAQPVPPVGALLLMHCSWWYTFTIGGIALNSYPYSVTYQFAKGLRKVAPGLFIPFCISAITAVLCGGFCNTPLQFNPNSKYRALVLIIHCIKGTLMPIWIINNFLEQRLQHIYNYISIRDSMWEAL